MKYLLSTGLLFLLFINKAESTELIFPAYIQDKSVFIDTYSIENNEFNILGIKGNVLKCAADKKLQGFVDITYLSKSNKPYSFNVQVNEFMHTLEVYQTFNNFIDTEGYLYVEDNTFCK